MDVSRKCVASQVTVMVSVQGRVATASVCVLNQTASEVDLVLLVPRDGGEDAEGLLLEGGISALFDEDASQPEDDFPEPVAEPGLKTPALVSIHSKRSFGWASCQRRRRPLRRPQRLASKRRRCRFRSLVCDVAECSSLEAVSRCTSSFCAREAGCTRCRLFSSSIGGLSRKCLPKASRF